MGHVREADVTETAEGANHVVAQVALGIGADRRLFDVAMAGLARQTLRVADDKRRRAASGGTRDPG